MSAKNQRNENEEWAEWENAMRGTTPEFRAEVFEICEKLQKDAQAGLDALERVPAGDMSAADRADRANRLQYGLEVAHARMEFLKPLIEADQARQTEEADRQARASASAVDLDQDHQGNEPEDLVEWKNEMRVTTPEYRAEVLADYVSAREMAQTELDVFQNTPAGGESEEERRQHIDFYTNIINESNARIAILEPLVAQDKARQAEVDDDLEGGYNGFDWAEVEEAVARDSAALDETDVYKNRVNTARADWARTEPIRIHSAPAAAPQPMASAGARPQPTPAARSNMNAPQSRPTSTNESGAVRQESAPNLWQRYMPEVMGGWSSEKVKEWDRTHPKEAEQGKPQTEVAPPKVGEDREVFKGVTVSELREAGYSSEQIQRMDMMAARARPRSGGLIATLGAASQANITREDYIHAGFNNQDIATIYKLSQNNR